jgi:hypothetical protein
MKPIKTVKDHQQTLVLALGYILVAGTGFFLGQATANDSTPPEIRIEEVFSYVNDSAVKPQTQSVPTPAPSNDCANKIKGNISASGNKIYHVPQGSFYQRTVAEICFATEEEAIKAGFRKSLK